MSKTLTPSQGMSPSPYLSIVAASRNDDHGGDPLIRTQIFINNIARQCEKYRLPAELIIVDWNPVSDRPGLAAVLDLPPDAPHFKSRVVTVPTALHQRLKYADKLSLFQMIAKNVGIRRALGQFILATNIDIIFSDELIQFIAKKKLNIQNQYRVDRYDIHKGLSKNFTLSEMLEYAWANPIRANRRYCPEVLLEHLYGNELFKRACKPDAEFTKKIESVDVVYDDGVWQLRPDRLVNMSYLHTNACGDFTLLSREGWEAIRGYPEFASYSFNIDSMGMVAAHYAGYEEVSLLPPCVCFHIEHGIGSGWTPEGENKLFNRLREAGILNPEWPVLMPLVDEMREKRNPLEFNHNGWGMADFDLPENALGDTSAIPQEKLDQLALQVRSQGISAIQPVYDLDRLTLLHERRLARKQSIRAKNIGSMVFAEHERVVVYIPDADGDYFEKNTIADHVSLLQTKKLIFRVEQFAHQFPLRFDPCQLPGLIHIYSVTAFDVNRMVWEFNGHDLNKLIVSGTADVAQSELLEKFKSKKALCIISTGMDPQVTLPPLPKEIRFPLMLSIEMSFIPSK